MKNTKIAASLLAVAMLAGVFAGCSKTSDITADKFVKACGKLGLEEYEDYLDSMPGLSDAEDGCYMVADDEDTIEELMEETLKPFLILMDLDDDIEAEDITSISAAVKGTGFEDMKDYTSLDELKTNGAAAIQITLKKTDFAEEIIDGAQVFVPWQRVDDFSNSNKFSRHFMLDTASGEVIFGPSVRQPDGSVLQYGRIPESGRRIQVTDYRYGGGIRGNLPENAVMRTDSSSEVRYTTQRQQAR